MNFTLCTYLCVGFIFMLYKLENANTISLYCLLCDYYGGWKTSDILHRCSYFHSFLWKIKSKWLPFLFVNVTSNVNHIHLFCHPNPLNSSEETMWKMKAVNCVLHVDYTCLRIIENDKNIFHKINCYHMFCVREWNRKRFGFYLEKQPIYDVSLC